MAPDLVSRFRRWVVVGIAVTALLYVAGSVWAGFRELGTELGRFQWVWILPVIALTLGNYFLRFLKWHYLLGSLGVAMPWKADAWNFTAGLSMAISPGKAGELLKPYVVRAVTGTPMARTVPALITERLTDAIALLILAGVSITTFAADQVMYVIVPSVLTASGLAVLASRRLSLGILGVLGKVPLVNKVQPKLLEMYEAMRLCVAPVPLFITVAISVVAWGAECLGFQLVFTGLGVDAPFDVCFFLYAFATVAGSAMPGGIGVAEGALAVGAMQFLPGLTEAEAAAASLLTRLATLWLGVGLGALALIKVSSMLGGKIDLQNAQDEPPA